MTDTRTSLEVIAATVEEATARGVAELGVSENDVEIAILDEGNRGLFGIGNRDARIRLILKNKSDFADSTTEKTAPAAIPAESAQAAPTQTDSTQEEAELVSREIVAELLNKMGIDAHVEAHWGDPVGAGHIRPLHVAVHGKDLSILIGRRAETLNALQYISRLIVAKELHRPVAIVIDVEGYRARRERQLINLAQRMSQQVIERGRSIALEPMPSNERRIIHLELRNNAQVFTESIGEGNRRKVTIFPQG